MSGAFRFLLLYSLKNRILSRLRRLRSPKYLISVLAGLGYLAFVFFKYPLRAAPAPDRDALQLLEAVFTVLLTLVTLYHWVFSTRGKVFDEAEVQILFPAPVSRADVLQYRIARAQPGILFGSLVTFLVFSRGGIVWRPEFLLVTIWLVYSFLSIFRIAVWLTPHTPAGRKLRPRISRIVFVAAIGCALWIWRFLPPPAASDLTPQSLLSWLHLVTNSGPLFLFLLPFRILLRPAFAPGFFEFVMLLIPGLIILAAVYWWILLCSGGLESAVLGKMREAPREPKRRRAQPFALKPAGAPFIAIYWKNLLLAGRFSGRKAITLSAVMVAILILALNLVGSETASAITGALAVALAGFLTFLGPVLLREDLRTDLTHAGLLKTYPLSGREIVLGEVLAPATRLTLMQWALIFIAASVLPNTEEVSYSAPQRFYAGAAAFLLLPCLGFIGTLVQNASALLLPGWIQLGKEHKQGIEAMGERLISSIATAVSLVIAAVPGALVFTLVLIPGYRVAGQAIIPVAALASAVVLIAEAVLGIMWLGKLFDRFDPSKELDSGI
ncbi:MAG: hypothetical protein GXX84_09995 [Acidobacteria bacterium]|nr:hypothetical protein [Acidobacteriota bacterium]